MKYSKAPRYQNNTDELISNISQLMAEAEEMLSESTSQHAQEKVALLRSRDESERRSIMEKYLAAKEKISGIARGADRTIRSCPYESFAIALGLGLVLGLSLRRSRE